MDSTEIYTLLRRKIIHLELPPESVLNLSDLAQTFNVSRTPIKEVLISLQAEDWIMRQDSHFIVTPLSLERIREITEIRMVLEVQANTWSMQRITPEETKGLLDIRDRMIHFEPGRSNPYIVDFDFDFHHYIFKCAKNAHLSRLLERLLSHYLRFWLSIPRQIDHKVFFLEALDLIDAILEKNATAIRDITTTHIRNSVAQIMGTL